MSIESLYYGEAVTCTLSLRQDLLDGLSPAVAQDYMETILAQGRRALAEKLAEQLEMEVQTEEDPVRGVTFLHLTWHPKCKQKQVVHQFTPEDYAAIWATPSVPDDPEPVIHTVEIPLNAPRKMRL